MVSKMFIISAGSCSRRNDTLPAKHRNKGEEFGVNPSGTL